MARTRARMPPARRPTSSRRRYEERLPSRDLRLRLTMYVAAKEADAERAAALGKSVSAPLPPPPAAPTLQDLVARGTTPSKGKGKTKWPQAAPAAQSAAAPNEVDLERTYRERNGKHQRALGELLVMSADGARLRVLRRGWELYETGVADMILGLDCVEMIELFGLETGRTRSVAQLLADVERGMDALVVAAAQEQSVRL